MPVNPLKSESLDHGADLDHAFFTRSGGVSEGLYQGLNTGLGSQDDPAAVKENRNRAASFFGVSADHLATPHQVHSARAVTASPGWTPADKPRADAVVTDRPGLAVGVGTADCGPILFADPKAGIVAAAHAGWKGALTGVLEATIQAMTELGGTRDNIVAVLGPTISVANYEVGPEFRQRFEEADRDNGRYFSGLQANGHAHFDLPSYIVDRLRRNGLASASYVGACTYADEDLFYSYRRATHKGEEDYGRLLSAIVLKEDG